MKGILKYWHAQCSLWKRVRCFINLSLMQIIIIVDETEIVLFIIFHNENRNIIILTSKSHSEPKRVIVFHAGYE
jgi:hypothetical protein